MADINSGATNDTGKGKPQKLSTRVDFTPLVDMNMLLLTFFMFCTTMSKPQVMELAMPAAPEQEIAVENLNKVKDSKAITLILGAENMVYYYFGKVEEQMYEDYTSLRQTDFSPEGLRAILLERNRPAIEKVRALKRQRRDKQISEEEFENEVDKIKADPDGQVVVIKPSDESTYENLVDALDEMQICSIGSYALVDMTDADYFLWQNYLTEGRYGALAAGQPDKQASRR